MGNPPLLPCCESVVITARDNSRRLSDAKVEPCALNPDVGLKVKENEMTRPIWSHAPPVLQLSRDAQADQHS